MPDLTSVRSVATRPHRGSEITHVLVGSAKSGLVTAVVVTCVAVAFAGLSAAEGALLGGVAAAVVLAAGTWVVLRAAQRAPAASLLVALLVFTLQGAILAGVLAMVSLLSNRTHTVAAALSVVAVTVAWTTAFAFFVRRARIPIFDLADTSQVSKSRGSTTMRVDVG